MFNVTLTELGLLNVMPFTDTPSSNQVYYYIECLK